MTPRLAPAALAFALCACATARPAEESSAHAGLQELATEPNASYSAIGQAEAQRQLVPGANVDAVDRALRSELAQQAQRAHADAILGPTFTTEQRWYPPLPNSTLPRRVLRRVARGTLIRYGSASQTP